jgi:hypothetical protein
MSVISCWQWWKRSFSGHGAQERARSRIAEYPDWRRTCYFVRDKVYRTYLDFLETDCGHISPNPSLEGTQLLDRLG